MKTKKYWCKLHKEFYGEEYVNKKKCLCKQTPDMLGVRKCNHIIETKDYDIKFISGNYSFKEKESKL